MKYMQVTMIDPEEQKYYLHQGRFITTKNINEKRWRKSHLIFAWHNHLLLKTMQFLLDYGYCIHHKNRDTMNDTIKNLVLMKKTSHHAHHYKEHDPPHTGKKLSEEHRKKLYDTHYRYDIKNENILDLVINQKLSMLKTGKLLSISETAIRKRLKSLNYINTGSDRKPVWIKGGIKNDQRRARNDDKLE